MNISSTIQPIKHMSNSDARVNVATGFASLAMTVYLWIQLAQVVITPTV